MKKKAITLILLLFALAVMIGAYFVVTRLPGDNGADTAAPDPTVTILTIDIETLNEISYRAGGEDWHFVLENGAWHWSEDKSLKLDSAKFAAMVEGMLSLTSKVTIASPDAEMLTDFGLAEPANVITLTDGGGTHIVYVGNLNSYNGSYYVGIDSTNTVHMAAAAAIEAFDMQVNDLLAYDALPAITAGKISSVTLERGEKRLDYTYYGSGNPASYTDTFLWYASQQGGAPYAVATDTGNALSSAITSLSFDDCVSYRREADAAAYGLDAPARLTIGYRASVEKTDAATGETVTADVETSFVLLLGSIDEATGCYYASVDGSSLIYLLSSPELHGLLEPEEILPLPEQIAPFKYDYIDKIVFEAGVSRLSVIIGHGAETTYTVGGSEVAYSSLSALFSAAQSLKAESTVSESAPDTAESDVPSLRMTVTFNRGDVKEGVLTITPYNTNFDRVSFLGRDDQLISIRDTEALAALIAGYGK